MLEGSGEAGGCKALEETGVYRGRKRPAPCYIHRKEAIILELHFEPVTETNRETVLKLGILPGQKPYIETVAQCLSEADENEIWRPVGIYHGDLLVGFAMYGFFLEEYPPEGRLWLDRLLIDARYQGRGYGREALIGLLERLSREYPGRDVYLSVIKGNDVAVHLYEQFGFRFIGEKDIHGEDVMARAGERQL